MARKPRFILPGVPQHIIQRGNNREPCFYAVEDYARYLHDLSEAAKKNHAAIHAYVLIEYCALTPIIQLLPYIHVGRLAVT